MNNLKNDGSSIKNLNKIADKSATQKNQIEFKQKVNNKNMKNNNKGYYNKKSNSIDAEELGFLASINNNKSRHQCHLQKELSKMTMEDFDDVPSSKFQNEKIRKLQEIVLKIEQEENFEIIIPEFGDGYKVDYKNELNDQQLAAVITVLGPLLVIAGAGTGKTHLLAYRVLFLIESGVNPAMILLLTFTKKAAKEMLSRVDNHRNDNFNTEVTGGTFHSFAVRVIRQYHTYFDVLPNFTIADRSKSESIIDLARTNYKLNTKGLEFPTKRRVFEIISKARNTNVSIKDVIEKQFTGLEEKISDIENIYEWYTNYKQSSSVLDFDDLMIVLRDKLRDDVKFRKIIQEKYEYIMVDEYQDTIIIQKDIVDLMANENKNVMVVGDDAQSIYAFRGANYENILRFPEISSDCKIIKLEKNYRSTQKLIDFTNSINNSFLIGYKKQLHSFRSDNGKKPIVKKFIDQEQEATFIVDKIQKHHENGTPYHEMAVLCRSAWFWQHIEQELIRRNIPYITVGGVKFIEKEHIQDMLAYLTVLQNPLDAVVWHRILKLEQGVGKITASKIVTDIHQSEGSLDTIKPYKGTSKGVSNLFKMLKEANSDKISMPEKISIIKEYYKPILERKDESSSKSLLDIEVFQEFAEGYNDLEEMLTDFSLNPFADKFADKITPSVDETEEKPVTLTTIHSSKGLEWGVVFLPHSLDGLFPSSKSMGDIEELEEENRVFYVATTRAKDRLYVTMPSNLFSNGNFYSLPSRFLVKIDKNTYKNKKGISNIKHPC